jgi:glycosyltransferase involved in cell wall biosynthesis
MHIVYIAHQFFPRHVGGVEVYTLALAKRTLAAGHQVTVITYHESPSLNAGDFGPQYTSYQDIPVVEIHYNLSTAPNPAQYEYNNSFTANILRHILLKLKPDLVHVMHAIKLSASILNVCDALQIPFIVTLCDFWFICPRHTLLKWDLSLCNGPAHPLYCVRCVQELHGFAKRPHLLRDLPVLAKRNPFIKDALLKARRIIALSDFQKKMHAENGIPAERMEVISHGLESSNEQPKTHLFVKPYCIGYIGSLVEHKGIHILLEALGRLPDLDLKCEIYGALNDTPYAARLRALAARDQRVEFRGSFDPENMSEVIKTLDILAVPSLWYENEPLVIKSALQAGIPVLCNDIGSLSGMIIPGQTGWLVSAGEVNGWTNAIQKAIVQLQDFHMQPQKIKSMDENADEMLLIYSEEAA